MRRPIPRPCGQWERKVRLGARRRGCSDKSEVEHAAALAVILSWREYIEALGKLFFLGSIGDPDVRPFFVAAADEQCYAKSSSALNR